MLHDPNHDGALRDVSYIPLQVEHGIGLTSPLELPPSCRKMHARRPFSSNRPVRLTLPQGGVPFSTQDPLGRAGERKTAMF
jgi:hypothetical protein